MCLHSWGRRLLVLTPQAPSLVGASPLLLPSVLSSHVALEGPVPGTDGLANQNPRGILVLRQGWCGRVTCREDSEVGTGGEAAPGTG